MKIDKALIIVGVCAVVVFSCMAQMTKKSSAGEDIEFQFKIAETIKLGSQFIWPGTTNIAINGNKIIFKGTNEGSLEIHLKEK